MCINKLKHRMNTIRCKNNYKDIYQMMPSQAMIIEIKNETVTGSEILTESETVTLRGKLCSNNKHILKMKTNGEKLIIN